MATLNHSWGAKVRMAAVDAPTGCDQTEQRCWCCGLRKIAVRPPQGLPYVVWRTADDPRQFTYEGTPPCMARPVGATGDELWQK